MMRRDTQNGTYHKALAAGCVGVPMAVRWSGFLTEFSGWKGCGFAWRLKLSKCGSQWSREYSIFGGFCM